MRWLWMSKWKSGSERQAKDEQWLWTPNYECQAEKDDSERRNREDMVALKAKLKQ